MAEKSKETLKNLKKIDLSNCFISTKTFTYLGRLLKNCRTLKEIDLSGCALGYFIFFI